jgi:hypothetical protein
MITSGEALPSTFMEPVKRLTAQDSTPSTAETAFSTRALQAAQDALSGSMKNVSVVKSSDVCEHDDIHPKTKDKLAARIAAILDGYIG